MKDKIINITNEGMNLGWTFPQLYAALKEIKVTKYTVEVADFKIIYNWRCGGEYIKESTMSFEIKNQFSAKAIKDIIVEHNKTNGSFVEFIKNIANNGCTHYVVDFKKDHVVYYGKDETEKHIEEVPLV